MELDDPHKAVDTWNGRTVEVPEEHRANGSSANGQASSTTRLQKTDQKLSSVVGSGLRLSHRGLMTSAPTAGTIQHSTSGNHPILQITRHRYGHGHLKDLQLAVYHAMRRYVPTLDTAIDNRRMLEGDLQVESDDEGLQDAIETFIERVPVGYIDEAPQRGLDTYLDLLSDRADEYGLAAGEIRVDGSNIERLVVPNSRTLSLRDGDGDGLDELYQSQTRRSGGRADRRIDDNERVDTLTFTQPTEGGWPRPLAWSLVTTTEAVLRMYEAVVNGWYRFGDPSMLFTEEYDLDAQPDTVDEGSNQVPATTKSLASQIKNVMVKRKNGRTADAFHAVQGAEVSAEVLGNVDDTLMQYFEEHQSVYGGMVVSAAKVPRWMHPELQLSGDGLNSSRAENENSLAAEAAKKRDRRRVVIAGDIIDEWLTLNGDARFTDRYSLSWDRQSLANRKLEAEARLTEAQADAQIMKTANVLFSDGERRFDGDHEQYLEDKDVYPETES